MYKHHTHNTFFCFLCQLFFWKIHIKSDYQRALDVIVVKVGKPFPFLPQLGSWPGNLVPGNMYLESQKEPSGVGLAHPKPITQLLVSTGDKADITAQQRKEDRSKGNLMLGGTERLKNRDATAACSAAERRDQKGASSSR